MLGLRNARKTLGKEREETARSLSFTNNELEIFHTAWGRRSFIVSEFVQGNPNNSLAACVNL